MTAQVLGQMELLEASPGRKLIVPAGHTAWWGVDPSTRRCAIGVYAPDRHLAAGPFPIEAAPRFSEVVSFPALEGGRRLAVIARLVRGLAAELAASYPPGVVVVEQPSGKTPNLELVYATGVILGALSEAVTAVTGHAIRVETVPSATWKRVAVGRGDVRKPSPADVLAGVVYGVLSWARALGYEGSSWDEADAWGVADYARRSIVLEERS